MLMPLLVLLLVLGFYNISRLSCLTIDDLKRAMRNIQLRRYKGNVPV